VRQLYGLAAGAPLSAARAEKPILACGLGDHIEVFLVIADDD
jgi:hypothetical protein